MAIKLTEFKYYLSLVKTRNKLEGVQFQGHADPVQLDEAKQACAQQKQRIDTIQALDAHFSAHYHVESVVVDSQNEIVRLILAPQDYATFVAHETAANPVTAIPDEVTEKGSFEIIIGDQAHLGTCLTHLLHKPLPLELPTTFFKVTPTAFAKTVA
ncbi:hypothetical protein IV38_GL001567 [Lactobacillus selangorensis]|uniref:Uncharacterized protein n=1 Tax=Lactobacillus selangorensis TaxID=81857 RepID=A0A0R2FP28_9LACO|nr:hypothetical protein [Lactobacillus selangorensis]KRN28117.1 hypothetical protein IV38_GL001567 [Lactobacillus selangorensis]KRN31006.1 hypothetical protein IV40_GL001648 [Lactobacillus selangorensis]